MAQPQQGVVITPVTRWDEVRLWLCSPASVVITTPGWPPLAPAGPRWPLLCTVLSHRMGRSSPGFSTAGLTLWVTELPSRKYWPFCLGDWCYPWLTHDAASGPERRGGGYHGSQLCSLSNPHKCISRLLHLIVWLIASGQLCVNVRACACACVCVFLCLTVPWWSIVHIFHLPPGFSRFCSEF